MVQQEAVIFNKSHDQTSSIQVLYIGRCGWNYSVSFGKIVQGAGRIYR